MQIYKSLYEKLLSELPVCPPEVGGILGTNQDVVIQYWLDKGIESSEYKICSYIPDTQKMNKKISEWCDGGITFAGIFHTHFWGNFTLSKGDIAYIRKIMNHMPETIEKLYFPIITMPERKLHVYVAIKGIEVIIKEEICQVKEDKP
ncbi:MAG: hypothetical protein Q4E24_01645 [bacterium]|nr:hypothetical protein [bacterium]